MVQRWSAPLSMLAGALIATTAHGGDTLHLKSGNFDAAHKTQRMQMMAGTANAKSTDYYLVQFKEVIRPQDKEDLKSLGVEIFQYIPDDALLVKGERKVLQYLSAKNSRVRVTMPYVSPLRISPDFAARSIFNAQKNQEIEVYIVDKSLNTQVRNQLQALAGVRIQEGQGKVLLITSPNSQLENVAAVEGVEFIQPKTQVQLFNVPLDDLVGGARAMSVAPPGLTGYESGTLIMNFDAAWSRGYTGTNELVAMADTGLDTGNVNTAHEDFEGLIGGSAYGLFGDSWEDPHGHGTHVAGSVMGSGAASDGAMAGGAFGAEMYGQGMWSPVLGNITPPTDLSEMFDDAYEEGARIHTNSWGSAAAGTYTGAAVQVDEYMWDNPDFLILFAAGNSGIDADKNGVIDADSIGSPATAKNALTVGASENYLLEGGIQKQLKEVKNGEPWGVEPLGSDRLSDDPNGIAAFSSRGPTNDGRIKPDVVAPGTNIVSLCSTHTDAGELWGRFDESYCYSGGTSMSTPLVAGAAAVLRQALVEDTNNEEPSAALVKAILMATATDLYPGQYGEGPGREMTNPGPNNQQGYGRVDLDLATDLEAFELVDAKEGVKPGRGMMYGFRGTVTKVTLVYTDAPGSPGASKALVNNLDLKVELADGTILRSQSRVNNSEQVVIHGKTTGVTKVTVEGVNVPESRNGALPFALVVSR